jgi:hypothetical protein
MRNVIRWAALAAVCMTFCSCGLFSSEQVQAALDIINQMEAQNTVTAAQAEALREAMVTNTGEPWYMQAGRLVLEVGMAVLGVRMWRGPSATLAERVARRAA